MAPGARPDSPRSRATASQATLGISSIYRDRLTQFGSLFVLRASMADLDPRPAPTGDIARQTEQAGADTKRILVGMVDEMTSALRTGRHIVELQKVLSKFRQIVDGEPLPPDLIVGPAAAQVLADLDQALRAISSVRS